jgi:hypothetical protein
VKEDGKEYLRVSFSIEGTGQLKDENLADPEFTIKNTGSFKWDIAESRVASVESEREMGFETEVATPQGNVAGKFTGTGKTTITMTYAMKEEKKDGK